jgi:cathepsin L
MLVAHFQVFLCACLFRAGAADGGSLTESCGTSDEAQICKKGGGSLIQKIAMLTKGSSLDQTTPGEFQIFMQKHGHRYAHGTREYEKRMALFQERLWEVNRLNSRTHRLWTAGINRLSDRTEEELASLRGWRGGAVRNSHHDQKRSSGGIGLLSVSGRVKPLPDEVSWTHLNTSKQIRDQGGCGSCWAIASATVLEAHSEIHMAKTGARSFSAQELVSCVPNADSCGGTGGCDGATVELAFNWALSNGLASEDEVPYQEVTGQCLVTGLDRAELLAVQAPSSKLSAPGSHQLAPGMKGSSFGMTGWERLPENGYEPLMRALVERGPVAVSVAASRWFSYAGGIFDQCDQDPVIDHAVTLVGYGADEDFGEKYWLIQNSGGPDWGESGHIRLVRRDGDETESCGTDHQPEVGTGCKGGPTQVKVCGQCGVLYDSVVPHFGEADADTHYREQLGHAPASN